MHEHLQEKSLNPYVYEEVPLWRQVPLGKKNDRLLHLMLEVLVQIFSNVMVYSQKKLWGTKPGLTRDCVITIPRTSKNIQKGRIGKRVSYLYACLGKKLLHPSTEDDTRRDRVNGVLVNTFSWANTRKFKERGKRETLNSIGSAFNCIPIYNGMLFI
jgi:hypothetical protein